VLAYEVGGRWAAECGELIRDLLRVRATDSGSVNPSWQLLGQPAQLCSENGPQVSAALQLADPEEPSGLWRLLHVNVGC